MLGLPPADAWLAAMIVVSIGLFLATARWSRRLAEGRALTTYSIGVSLAFSLLAVLTGLALFRE
jgi:low temperature requirement protein LtrA